ncbi:MAG: hypothetical protein RQM92_15140 [Candidatus Syntrophopropionicum ammoniitolerans]
MMPYEDVFVQLVDTPPITEDIVPPGLVGTLRNADILLVFVDVASDDCLEQLEFCLDYLRDKKVIRENLMAGAWSVLGKGFGAGLQGRSTGECR